MPFFDGKDKGRYATFTRRTALVSGGMAAVFGVLAARLFQLQILEGDRYLTAAENNRINERLLAPRRGRILDRFGVELASSRRNYRVLVVPEQTLAGLRPALDALAKVIPLPEWVRDRLMREAAANRAFIPLVAAENLSWNDYARLNLDLPYLQGVQPDVGETRDYPFGPETSHVLGYVAQVSPNDKTGENAEDPLLDVPGLRIGKRGIEQVYDRDIRGQAGASRVEVNAYGRVIKELDRLDGTPGKDVYLTIDRELQRLIYERLASDSAGCAVMDVESGDVLALVSTPGFDPNAFNVGLTSEEWTALTQDDHKPLLNKVLSGAYPPGSTFKTITALAALENGAIGPDFTVHCAGQVALGSHVFHCWKRGGHGAVGLRRGIQQSCDVFFYEVARRVGIDALERTARRLGLGAPVGIEIPGERSGFVPSRAWKQATFKEPWQEGETLNTGIGQGFLTATPLQLCTVAARIASGKEVSPRIVHTRGTRTEPRRPAPPLGVSDAALALVRDGMNAATNEPGGTAYAWRILQDGFRMAGKTGTAQVRRITAQERVSGVRRNEDLPWKLRDHALYIAFAPVEQPRYACAVVIEHGAVAAHPQVQVARDALLFAQQRNLLGRPTAYPLAAADAGALIGRASR